MKRQLASFITAALASGVALAGGAHITSEDSQLTGLNGWITAPNLTVSEFVPSTDPRFPNGYQATGIFDGMGALQLDRNTIRVFVNSELNQGNGYSYTLANGTELTGARVSYFDIDRATGGIIDGGIAYDRLIDRAGNEVTDPEQINYTGNAIDGFARFCSARLVQQGRLGFVDDIFFTNEETTDPNFHPVGGAIWALDADTGTMYDVPALGRGTWENVTPMFITGNRTALLLGDDFSATTLPDGSTIAAPLYLYVGEKDAIGDGSFLDRNGLAVGQLYYFMADDPAIQNPEDFNGTGGQLSGFFAPIDVQDVAMAGMPGFDQFGFKNGQTLKIEARDNGAFQMSRPEDVHNNPRLPFQAAIASTGGRSVFPSDTWGTVYVLNLNPFNLSARLDIAYDSDDAGGGQFADPDFGLRSGDNLVWARDRKLYVQEDRANAPFGGTSGEEASIWSIDPTSGAAVRVAQVDRSVVVPAGTTDIAGFGGWETSGIIDVTEQFGIRGATAFLLNVQAHGIRDGAIGDNPLLDEGGQLMFMYRLNNSPAIMRHEIETDVVNDDSLRDLQQLR